MPQFVARRSALAAAAALFALPFAAQAVPQRTASSAAEVLKNLSANTGGQLVSKAIANDSYAAVHAVGNAVLLADDVSASPESRARFFLSVNGALPGVTDSSNQLKLVRTSKDAAGTTHVHMDQMQSGLPVFGARLVVHMNNSGITGMNGVFVPNLEGLSIAPEMSTTALRARAIAAATRLHPMAKTLTVESSRLMIYNTGLLQSLPGSNRLAYETMVTNGLGSGVRERIILDANSGAILNRIDEIKTVLNRKIYTPVLNLPTGGESTPVLTEKGTGAPADPAFKGDVVGSTRTSNQPPANLYIFAGGTWLLYKNLFGADGYDFTRPPAGGQVQKSVYLINDQCPNAYWDGTSTNYCPGFDADDVVSHEWSHAYTEYTHGLVYQYQSGALNEAYSDIFGETYDLVNGLEGPAGASLTEGNYFKTAGSRWVVGEDLGEVAAGLLLRDMWDPDDFTTPSPGSVITSPNYECGTGDNGGVHTNSGVANHAYAMLVDGRPNAKDNTTFNGVAVPKIGLLKAARIFFHAETNYQTPTTNFTQHADALEQSCQDLKGVALTDVFGAASAEKITQADCDAVHAVTLAVEYRGKPGQTVAAKCNYVAILRPESTTPALCAAGKVPSNFFSEGFDGGAALPSGWTQGHNLPSGGLDIPHWTTSTNLPAPHTGRAAFFGNKGEGSCAAPTDASASHFLDSPAVTVPVAASFLRFTHFMQSEALFDGGNLKMSVNGGAFVIVPPAAFTYNAHSGTFSAAMGPTTPTGNNTSPNAGQRAWTGSDQGEATGSWGTTIVDLSKLAAPPTAGQTVKFRFDFANDGCGGNLGWFVEDVNAFQCLANAAPVASFTVTPSKGVAPLAVSFNAAASSDPDAGDSVASYTINYGDGSAAVTQSTPSFSHSYVLAGSYTPKLTVTDTRGTSSTEVSGTTVVVSPAPSGAAAFTFIDRVNVPLSTFVTSETITLSNFSGTLPVSISSGNGGQYSINGAPFSNATGATVKAGDKLVVRHISSNLKATAVLSTVTVGSYNTSFKSTTESLDRVPDAFSFGSDKTGLEPGVLVESPVVTLTGFDVAPIVAGPGLKYSQNGGAFTSANGTLNKGDTLKVQHTTNTKSLGYTKSYVRVGGVTGYFTTRTE